MLDLRCLGQHVKEPLTHRESTTPGGVGNECGPAAGSSQRVPAMANAALLFRGAALAAFSAFGLEDHIHHGAQNPAGDTGMTG